MSLPIVDLQKVSSIVVSFDKFGSADGIDGAKAATLISAKLSAPQGSVAAAGQALLDLYNLFGVDAVNVAVSAALAGTLTVDGMMLKVLNAAR